MNRLLILIWLLLLGFIQTIEFNTDRWQALAHVRLIAPSVEVNQSVTRFYLGRETWEISPWETQIGHFEGTAWFNGNIVLGAHVEYPDGTPGIFSELHTVQVGDVISLEIGLSTHRYRVVNTQLVAYDNLTVLYPTTDNQLTLVTCDEASYNTHTGEYSQRLVVIAKLES